MSLLDEINAKTGKDKIVSVAGSHWMPDSLNLLSFIKDFRWSVSYYRDIGTRADQIEVMTYDSTMPVASLYRLWSREQVKAISEALKDVSVNPLFGISVSREETFTHRPSVENLENGLAGICAGAAKTDSVRGVVIYANWEFAETDWGI